jgi:hypothetical protein
MNSEAVANCARLQRAFEGREAILVEQGAVRVRISNIEAKPEERYVSAQVQAIPTRGLPTGALYNHAEYRAGSPFRIAGGYLTCFSDQVWEMGYGGWKLFFAPKLVNGIVELAAQWPDDLHPAEGYNRVSRWLADQGAYDGMARPVFPKARLNP